MPKMIEKREVFSISEGKCTRVETKISDDGKSVEFTLFCEVKTQEELRREEEERARREAEAIARKEEEERTRREAEAKARKEEEERTKRELEAKVIKEEKENKTKVEPTLENYMKAMKKKDELSRIVDEERASIEERTKRTAYAVDIPSYDAYSQAVKEFVDLAERVEYCGMKAINWIHHGFKNERKTWELLETWMGFGGNGDIFASKVYLQRKRTWTGTLEEYVTEYGMYITGTSYSNNLKYISGYATKNIPQQALKSDTLEVEIMM